ncbi:hypothetical protein C8D03_3555 [Bosea sp. 124]|nr:hypothetical protein C8D03_3555 [Bosea sp. 124]
MFRSRRRAIHDGERIRKAIFLLEQVATAVLWHIVSYARPYSPHLIPPLANGRIMLSIRPTKGAVWPAARAGAFRLAERTA